MSSLPKALEDLIEALGQLPGVGPRSAERYSYFLLKSDSHKSKKLAAALDKLKTARKHLLLLTLAKKYLVYTRTQAVTKLLWR